MRESTTTKSAEKATYRASQGPLEPVMSQKTRFKLRVPQPKTTKGKYAATPLNATLLLENHEKPPCQSNNPKPGCRAGASQVDPGEQRPLAKEVKTEGGAYADSLLSSR